MIRVSNLTKNYGLRRAVDQLSFTIEKGEIVAFLGPNGAGKTTTMRILAGYMPPTSGEVNIGGFDILENSMDVRKIVGYLPETVPLYNEMTVFDYLQYMADLRNMKDSDDRVMEVLEMVQLADRANGYIGKLSKGMRQRLGLAQALIHKPDVLILDEPTIGLDPAQIIEVRNLIREVGKDHTVLLSTHILSEAQQVCDRVLIINHGHIVAEDTTEGLQNSLMGSKRVVVELGTSGGKDPESALPTIRAIPNVLSASLKDNAIEFEISPQSDPRPEVARALVTAGYDLLSMRQTSLSLEEIFLQLTSEERPQLEPEELTDIEPEEQEG